MPVIRLATLVVASLLLAGCNLLPLRQSGPEPAPAAGAQSTPLATTAPSAAAPASRPAVTVPQPRAKEPPRPWDLWQRLRAGFVLDHWSHRRIDDEIARWRERGRHLSIVGARAEPYLHYIVSRVESRGLPAEVALVPFVESGFDPRAYSPFHASGLWQFIPSTARHYGLGRDWWYDGRRDVVASTAAALDYLEYLNRLFDGDWLLTLAAYNAGEGTVSRAVARNRGRDRATDYWSLELPPETQVYVPRILALARILEVPEAHGVTLPAIADHPRVAVVDLEAPVELELAAELTGVDDELLRDLNPGYLRWATAPAGPHHLMVPVDKAEVLESALAELPRERWVRWHRHRVRPGDSLYVIARRYGTSVKTLQRLNGMSGTLLRVGRDLKVPRSPGVAVATGEPAPPPASRHHTVRPGDSLWTIARRHGLTVKELARRNGLESESILHPGQRLAVAAVEPDADAGHPAPSSITHVVRKGDSLWTIARRFRVQVSDLTRWNGLSRNSVLRPGQVLVLYPRTGSA